MNNYTIQGRMLFHIGKCKSLGDTRMRYVLNYAIKYAIKFFKICRKYELKCQYMHQNNKWKYEF